MGVRTARVSGGMKQEFRLASATGTDGKWPDLVLGAPDLEMPRHVILVDDVARRIGADSRIDNLRIYLDDARLRLPDAIMRLVVLTDAPSNANFLVLNEPLGPQVSDQSALSGWRLLGLGDTRRWLQGRIDALSDRQARNAEQYVDWVERLELLRRLSVSTQVSHVR